MIGQKLSHYKILSELGRGGMGIVYKAEDTKLDRTVAIKVLPSAALASEDDRTRFYREAKAAAQLHHPHIASVFEIDEAVPEGSKDDDLRPFIAMEFIEGETLEDHIKKSPLKLEEAIRIASQIASGLEAAHEKDIVHRDLKSQNVMLTNKGEAKILDFGLAQTAASTKLTRMGSTMGTVAYMSPEQARGEELDLRTDLWSLGVVLYEMVAGRSPFPGDYEQAVVYEILNQDPEPLTAVRTNVPVELELMVSKCLAKKASLRYQNSMDVITDLKRLEVSDSKYSSVSSRTLLRPPKDSQPISKPIYFASLVGAALAGALLLWIIGMGSGPDNQVQPIHVNLSLPDSIEFFDPSWSPDGSTLLFSAIRGNEIGFIVKYDLGTGTIEQITPPNRYLYPKYDPLGEYIYFISADDKLYRMRDGSEQISFITDTNARSNELGWLSNNELIYPRGSTVYIRDMETGEEDTLNASLTANFFRPSINSDSTLLFASSANDMDVLDLRTREVIPHLVTGNTFPQWITPNDFLLYYPEDNWLIWARKIDSRAKTFVGPGNAAFQANDWNRFAVSKQGHLIYEPIDDPNRTFTQEPIYSYTIGMQREFVAEANQYTQGQHDDIRISPDGNYLAIQTGDGIMRYDRNSRQVLSLTPPNSDTLWFRPGQWSGDGRYLYYEHRRRGVRTDGSIYRVDREGLNREPVVDEITNDVRHSISDDGRILVFGRQVNQSNPDDFDIWGHRVATGEQFPISTAQGVQYYPHISPDGDLLAYSSGPFNDASIIVLRLSDNQSTLIAENMKLARWSKNGKYLYYESALMSEIYRVELLANPPEGSPIFDGPELIRASPRADHSHWDTSADENTIMLSEPLEIADGASQWKIVLNWAQTLEKD